MIAVTDEDVASVATALGCDFGDEHTEFLKATGSCDLHAGPGSGKTTLLVAKLAILARKWPFRDRGVLVLSHTNVARSEVEHRLVREPAGARLLTYPHFIGTIQGFVDRFLALPFLREWGIADVRVDDELFGRLAAGRLYGSKDFVTARRALRQTHEGGRPIVTTLHYRGADLVLSAKQKIPFGPTTDSGKELKALKKSLTVDGVLRYADMFAFAARTLRDRPEVGHALRARFPMVFLDEMQDTSKDQLDLLQCLFGGEHHAFSRLGDRNQSIFGDGGDDDVQHELAWGGSVDLPTSQRLAPKLAEMVAPLAVVHPLRLVGNPRRSDRKHTIFMFGETSIAEVLPAFGDLILDQWPGGLPAGFVAKAVGHRKGFEGGKPPSPGIIGDYWSSFEPAPIADRALRATLVGSVRHAHRVLRDTGEYFAPYRVVVEALARLVELAGGRRCSRQLLSEESRNGLVFGADLNPIVARLLDPSCVANQSAWEATTRALCLGVDGKLWPNDLVPYLAWEAPQAASTEARGSRFVHRSGDREVAIEVATIHRVKGETHDATLVLETYFKTFDVRQAIPRLAGEKVSASKAVAHMKRMFVGATRPKELLCFAVHRDGVSEEQRTALEGRGWSVVAL